MAEPGGQHAKADEPIGDHEVAQGFQLFLGELLVLALHEEKFHRPLELALPDGRDPTVC
jgi:hypothetical protein